MVNPTPLIITVTMVESIIVKSDEPHLGMTLPPIVTEVRDSEGNEWTRADETHWVTSRKPKLLIPGKAN